MDVKTVEQFFEALIPRKDVLRILSVSAPTLREWERRRKITPIRIGGRVFFHVLEITNLIKISAPDPNLSPSEAKEIGEGAIFKKEESDERR
jgi:DNA-binding transcriptional MerR regulator